MFVLIAPWMVESCENCAPKMSSAGTGSPVPGEINDGCEAASRKEVEAPFQFPAQDVENVSPNILKCNFRSPVPDQSDKFGPQKKVKSASFHRKKSSPYTEPFLQQMLRNVRDGLMSMYHVNKYYGIPRATMQYRLGLKFRNKGRTGPDAVLTSEEEAVIVKWVQTMERRGFPITREALITRVAAYLRKNPRKNPCRDNVPGRRWLEGFMRRHSELTFRTPESVTSASAKVSEEDIRKWFLTVLDYLIEHDLIDALHDPSRILNGDETGFVMNSTPKKVLATKGAKNVPTVDTQNGKQNVTVLFSFSADGEVIPPDVILPYKRLSREIVQSFPSDWGLGTSETGWMNASNFTLYIKKVLYPSLVKRNVKFPVLYFVDGHKSHTALEAADTCAELGIVLIALYPNATRILQPADVSIFRPLKNSWGKNVEIWKTEHMAERLSIPTFGSLLKETMGIAFKKKTIINAFRVCGLYPFNANAVDYSKCIARSHSQPEPTLQAPTAMPATPMTMVERPMTFVPTTAIDSALRLIGDEKIKLYKSGDHNNFSSEDKILSFIYNHILTTNQSSNHEMLYSCEQLNEVEELNNIDLEAAIAEPLILLQDGSEYAVDLFANGPPSVQDYGHPTEVTSDDSLADLHNIDLEAAIAAPLIFLDEEMEFGADPSTNGSPSLRDYGHSTENPKDADSSIDSNVHLQHISTATKDLNNSDLVVALVGDGTGLSQNDEVFQDEDHPNEDTNDIDLGAVSDESLVLYEEGITRDLQLISDTIADQSNNQKVTPNYELYHDFQDPNALYFNDTSLDWNFDLEQDFLSTTEILADVPKTNAPSNMRVNAAEFFQAPPTPKRNPKHRNYRQKSYAILTAGERLAELRQIEINKAETEKAKKKKAEERTQKKLMKAAAALAKAEEKENAKKLREIKKQSAAQVKFEREAAKKASGKVKEKKKLVL